MMTAMVKVKMVASISTVVPPWYWMGRNRRMT